MMVNNQQGRERSKANKQGPSVRNDDRRVRKTQVALIGAFVSLVLEKRYDAITIQDLLDRADVGRSTFYAHYRGKDDLLAKSFIGMLEMLDREIDRDGPDGRRVAPVRELFRHIGEARKFQQALARAHVLERQYHAGVDYMSGTIERRLAALSPEKPGGVPLPVKAQALAGTLFALLRWWVDHDAPYTPGQMDAMYHAMAKNG
jgi:AcrR family transcriptional regulator